MPVTLLKNDQTYVCHDKFTSTQTTLTKYDLINVYTLSWSILLHTSVFVSVSGYLFILGNINFKMDLNVS